MIIEMTRAIIDCELKRYTMRIIKATFIVTICCVVSFAQPTTAQQTASQSQAKEQAVSQQTEKPTLPEKKPTRLDATQIQSRLSEILQQQYQSLSVDAERLRAEGIIVVPDTRFVMKNGAVYIIFPGQTLVPMIGGGASGCLGSSVPESIEKAGQVIFLAPKPTFNLPPSQDSTKKN